MNWILPRKCPLVRPNTVRMDIFIVRGAPDGHGDLRMGNLILDILDILDILPIVSDGSVAENAVECEVAPGLGRLVQAVRTPPQLGDPREAVQARPWLPP